MDQQIREEQEREDLRKRAELKALKRETTAQLQAWEKVRAQESAAKALVATATAVAKTAEENIRGETGSRAAAATPSRSCC